MEVMTKFVIAEKSETIDEERSVVGWGSKPQPDRDGELIEASAWDLGNFLKNPVMCLSHDLSKPPIGKILWAKATPNGLKFKAQFASTARAKEIYQLYKEGIMNSFSVGFRAKPGGFVENPMDEKYKGLKKVFKSVELFEISCVTVPALPTAVAEYVKSGKIQDQELKEELEELVEKATPAEEKKDGEGSETKTIEGENKEEPAAKPEDKKDEEPPKYVKDLMEEVKGLKAKVTTMEQEKKMKEEESKTLDAITGQPSAYDIMNSLSNLFQSRDTALPSSIDYATPTGAISESNRPYVYVVDIYPTTYPDGFVVFRVSIWDKGSNTTRTFRQGFTYNPADKKSTLVDEAIAVEEAWIAKRYDTEFLGNLDQDTKDEDDDLETKSGEGDEDDTDLETKAGRVLSAANRTKFEDLRDQLTDVADEIQAILDNADPEKSEDEDDEEHKDDHTDLTNKDQGDPENKGTVSGEEIDIDDDDPHVDDHTKGDGSQQDDLDDDIPIDAKELSEILSKSVTTAITEFRTTLKSQTADETKKLLGKATTE